MNPMRGARLRGHVLALLVLLVAAAWFSYPLFYSFGEAISRADDVAGFHNLLFDSHEKLHYVIRLSEVPSAMQAGQWMPRLCPNLAGGYGYPFFNFYAPLSYLLASTWHWLGFDLFVAWKLHFFLMTWLAGAGVWWLARMYFGALPSLAAALLYMFAPYHLVNLYVRGNVAEFTAMTILPFVFLGVQSVLRRPGSAVACWGAAVAMAAMVLTHNVTALLTAVAVAVWLNVQLFLSRRAALTAGFAVVGGVLLSCFFWLPALLELRHTKATGLIQTFSETPSHVVYWRQYFSDAWGFGLSEPGPSDQMPFGLGWMQWVGVIGCVASGAVAWVRAREWTLLIWPLATLAVLCLMSNWCAGLWALPGFAIVQFPWRLMVFAALFAALSAGSFLAQLRRVHPTMERVSVAAILLGLIVLTAPKISVVSHFPNPPDMYRPEATRQRFITTNIGEFLPQWAALDENAQISRRRVLTETGDVIRHVTASDVLRPTFRHDASAGQRLTYEMFYFPGWKAEADGEKLDTRPSPNGLVEFDAIPSDVTYQLRFGYSITRAIATGISIASLLIGLVITLWWLRHTPAQTR